MNVALWVVQGWLAAIFLIAGVVKLGRSKEALQSLRGMEYVADLSVTKMKLIGLAEVLGAIGLILPRLLHIVPG